MAATGVPFESDVKLLPGASADTDLSAAQWKLVKFKNATGGPAACGTVVQLCSAATDVACGVLRDAPLGTTALPVSCEVAWSGILKAFAGATVTAGDLLQVDATGRVITLAATGHSIGQALSGAAVGELVYFMANFATSPIKA